MRRKEKNNLSKQDEIRIRVEKEAARQRRRENRMYYIVGCIFSTLFLCMIGYFSWFMSSGSEEVINNSLNNRVKDMGKNVIRGQILAEDGTSLAYSQEEVDGSISRIYPFGNQFVHAIGYSTKGTSGIEKQENSLLTHANIGLFEQITSDIFQKKVSGNNVVTTIDPGLQQFCYNALGNNKGAVVVMETSTGKIRAMVSKPDFDPNNLDAIWADLTNEANTDANLLNRATQGHYPPGSTFKLLTALEYIRENPDTWQDFSYTCNGSLEHDGLVLNCHEGHAHGTVDVRSAVYLSCNGAFATMGLSLDRDKFSDLCQQFGFNSELPTELLYTKSSFVLNDESSDWDVMQTSIGQGKTMESPLGVTLITAAIANNGVMMSPYIVDRVQTSDTGEILKQYTPKEGSKQLLTREEVGLLKDFMTAVVAEGSGYRAGSQYCQVAGKTGSAQYNSSGGMHAWFTGFAPAENPEIAITIILEGGGSGGDNAAPVVGSIMDYYFGRKQG